MNKEEIHDANNAVIKAALDAAREHGVHCVIAVGHVTTTGDTPSLIVGVDSSGAYEGYLGMTAGGAAFKRSEPANQDTLLHAFELGAKCHRSLFDRGGVYSESKPDTLAMDDEDEL